MSEQDRTDQRLDEAESLAEDELPDFAKGVAQGPEGPGGAAGAGAPQAGVTGGDPELED